MAEPIHILSKINKIFAQKNKTDQKWVISGGATKEFIDPIRFLTNGSSGKTGILLAEKASLRGHSVVFVAGNVVFDEKSYPFKTIRVETADEMLKVVKKESKDASVLIMSSAVADFSFEKQKNKLKKSENDLVLTLKRTKDILKETISTMNNKSIRVGFAAETENLKSNAMKKLESKHLDLIVANLVSKELNPFGSDENSVLLISKKEVVSIDKTDKKRLASLIVDYVERLILEKK